MKLSMTQSKRMGRNIWISYAVGIFPLYFVKLIYVVSLKTVDMINSS